MMKNQIMRKSALLVGIIDNSGSMGAFERFISEKVFNDISFILDCQYMNVKKKGIIHHTEARLVDSSEMFWQGQCGGTIASSAYRLLNDTIEIVDHTVTDIYIVHFSDGDNLTSDNEKTVGYINELLNRCKAIGYVEINQYNRHSTLMKSFKDIKHHRFNTYRVTEKLDTLHIASQFLKV